MLFRDDINGLRAIAVIAVVLFHFNPAILPGGFAGVDVFFVISGYLMTGIIFKGLESNSFSVLQFYIARANRIIPALFVLCFTLLAFGWFYLTPMDYKELGQHVASSMMFISNINYWFNSGYFDTSSQSKWLLHTWSLSVEWQFYIFYPIALVLLKKFLPFNTLKYLILSFTILGFLLCIVTTINWPNAAFYLLHSRAWEMLFGGVAFLFPLSLKNTNIKKVLELLGFSLILITYIFISEDNIWPGYFSLMPVLGTYLVIQSNRSDSFLTGNLLFQKIGKWSYSIYLWHWPLVVIIYSYSLTESWIYLGVITSIFLGYLSNRYIESIKFKKDFKSIISYLSFKPLYMSVILSFIGSFIFFTNGAEFHYADNIRVISKASRDFNARRGECLAGYGHLSRECEYGEGEVGVIVLGDSHAQSLLPVIAEINPNKTLDWTLASCKTINGLFVLKNGKRYDACGDWLYIAIEKLPKNVPVIIHNWLGRVFDPTSPSASFIQGSLNKETEQYREIMSTQYLETICQIAENNPVIIINDSPYFSQKVPHSMSRKLILNDINYRSSLTIKEAEEQTFNTDKVYSDVVKECGVELIDSKKYLCPDGRFCFGDHDGIPIYTDTNHLNNEGAYLFKNILREKLEPYISSYNSQTGR